MVQRADSNHVTMFELWYPGLMMYSRGCQGAGVRLIMIECAKQWL